MCLIDGEFSRLVIKSRSNLAHGDLIKFNNLMLNFTYSRRKSLNFVLSVCCEPCFLFDASSLHVR